MSEQSDPRLLRWLSMASAGASLFSIFVGLCALLGWVLHVEILKTWLAGQVPVRFNGAICFVLLGGALWGLRESRRESPATRRLAQIAAATVLLFGVLSLLELLSGGSLAIGQWLHSGNPGQEIDPDHSARIPLIAALDFVLLGAALLILDWKTRRRDWPAQFVAGAAAIVACFGLLDFVLGREISHTHIALPSALNFAVFSMGIICARSEWAIGGLLTSPSPGARWLRRTAPTALAVVSILGWWMSTPLLTPAHLSWFEVSMLGVTAGIVIIAFLSWTALLLDRSERKRVLAEDALHLERKELNRLLGRYEDSAMETTVRGWSRTGIALGIVLTILSFLGFWRNLHQSAQDDDWVAQTHHVTTAIEATLAHCVDLETGARGFVATGDETYLEPYEKAKRALPGDLELLRSLTGDNPSQQKRVDLLQVQISARGEIAVRLINERRRTGTIPPPSLFAEGKHQMEEVRGTITEMQSEEAGLLEWRQKQASLTRQRMEVAILVVGIVGVTMLIFAGLITNREINRSAKMRGQIQGLNADLERRVEGRTAELRESEERLRALVKATSDVVYRMSPDWSEMQQLYGQGFIADTSAPSKDWFQAYIPADEQALVMRTIQNAIRNKSVFELEHRVRQADGNIGWTFSRAVPRLDTNGEIVEWVGMASNVTPRKSAEMALRQSQQQVEAIFQSAMDAIITVDEQQRIVMFNPAAEKMLGCAAAEALGQPLNRFIPAQFGEAHTEQVNSFGRTGVTRRHIGKQEPLSALRADGTELPAEISISQVEVGGRKLFTAIMRDVSERKRTEKALQESEEKLRLFIEHAPAALAMFDREMRYLQASRRWRADYGLNDRDLTGVCHYEAFPEVPQRWKEAHQRGLAGEVVHEENDRFERPDGRVQWLRWEIRPWYETTGKIGGIVIFAEEITARKQAEEQLAAQTEELSRQTEELTRSNRDLEQFAYVASHDLQEPLRMVAAYTQLLAECYRGQLDETADKYIGYAVEGAQRMQTLVQDLLNFSRIGRNGRQRNSTHCSLVLEGALLNLQAAIKESSAEVTHDELPWVIADQLQLVQLFQNLIGNAIKFRGKDAPRISVSAEKLGEEWVFAVRDNGIGIAPAHAEDIFVIFHRLHTRSEYPGNGMGLAICKKIVEQHGGRIWVESQPGQGSTFKFTLPALAADEEKTGLDKEEMRHAAVAG